jgi:tetratricopeptide (TPR) repeat protein/UDP-2,3-diacylglucosamine pyrophosphatase LpxH
MQVSWLHVSDFHIRGGDPYDRDVVLKTLVKSVRYFREQGRAPDLIFATGDIAHGGKPAEYELATKFFDDLLDAAKVDKRRLFVIPGNHDVDRTLGVGLARTLASREESDSYFNPELPKPHLTQKMAAFLSWHDEYFKGIRRWPHDTSCGPVELAEVRGTRLGILSMNSALFCQDDEDHNKLLIGRRSLDGALAKLTDLKTELNLALIHHPLDWLNDLERPNIKSALQSHVDFILRGHLHETEVENVASAYGQSLFCAAGAAYQTRKWPNRAMYASLQGRELTIFPIRYEDQPKEVWTVDPSLFPTESKNNYQKIFPLPRLSKAGESPAPAAPAEPAKMAALPRFRSNIPSRRGLPIVGREKDFEAILKVLNKPEKESVLVLHGHSGAGKSELAKEYARRHGDRYPGGTFLLDATAGALDVDFARIGKTLLGLNFPTDLSLPEQGQQTFYSLGSIPTLLIYDNVGSVDGVNPWLPPAGVACHVLITSVIDTWDGWQSHEVKPLTHEESLELIRELGGREVAEKYGEQLAALAGGLPIQICPAALTLALDQRRGRLGKAKLSLVPEADESFHLVYDRLEDPVRLLLHSAALFNQRIPRAELSTQLQQSLGWSETDFEKRLDACFDLHLLEGGADLKMHQLFARFLQATPLAGAQAKLLMKVRTAQAERFIELAGEVRDHPNRTDMASTFITFPLVPTAWDEAGAPIAINEGEAVGGALAEIGRFDEGRPWHERAVAAKEKGDAQGTVDHESLANSLHHVGFCLSQTGKYAEAQPWFERAVAEREKDDVYGSTDHDLLGRSLYQAGLCLSETGKYDDARSWYERAATEAEKGDLRGFIDHSELGKDLHQVGICLSDAGKYAEAQGWYERAVSEIEKGDVQGRVNHDGLGRSMHQVGWCLSATGEYSKASSWYKRAVAVKEKGDVHGRMDHDSLGRTMNQIGVCLLKTGKYAEAQGWHERAVAEAEKGDVHGRVDHQILGISLNWVGFCLSQIGRHAEAQPWYERAVAAQRKGNIFGKVDRESLARSLKAGADCLRKLGKTTEAEAWEKEAPELQSGGAS